MKAAVLYGARDLRYTDFETPKIDEHEILVRVKATGICGSDLPRVLGNGAHFYPIILGHEFSGEVVEVGSTVTNIKAGRGLLGSFASLLKCADCQKAGTPSVKTIVLSVPGFWQLGRVCQNTSHEWG